jgi:beta-lactamase class D
MKRVSLAAVALCLALGAGCACKTVHEDPGLKVHFGRHDAAFVMRSLQTGVEIRYGGLRCEQRVSPCSTFKVPHTLAAVDAGAVDDKTVFKWDGMHRGFEAWNRDQTLHAAMQNSVVWCYQDIARRMGAVREQCYLDLFAYGNQDMSGGLEQFWLMSSLKISPAEQVDFLARLYGGRLPVSLQSMEVTRRVLVLERGDHYVLSGKTGSGVRDGTLINNWFVGHVATGSGAWVFATNLQGSVKDRWEASRITRLILQQKIGIQVRHQ